METSPALITFIDESGSFSGIGKQNAVSCVGALTIPHANLPGLTKLWTRLRRTLPTDKGEVKGRLLSEKQVAQVADIVRKNQGLFDITAIDLGAHSDAGLLAHRADLADKLIAKLTPAHHENVHKTLNRWRTELLEMKLPGYVQSTLTFDLLARVMDHSTLYHCQRNPKELGNFVWVVDAKDSGSIQTPWEKWWQNVMLPTLQSRSLREPMAHLAEGDYRYFDRYNSKEGLPDWLIEAGKLTLKGDEPKPLDLRAVFSDLRFSSANEMGLELVDILTNGVRRALLGNLQPEGWLPIRSLMIHRSQQYITLVSMNGDDAYEMTYTPVLRKFMKGGRQMITAGHVWATE